MEVRAPYSLLVEHIRVIAKHGGDANASDDNALCGIALLGGCRHHTHSACRQRGQRQASTVGVELASPSDQRPVMALWISSAQKGS